jgi:dienelactone hydrolase
LAVPAGLAAMLIVFMIGTGLTETHKFRTPVGAPPSSDYREVAFKAEDGVKLSGWYRPTRNGATVIVLHGGGGDRTGARAHARMLARHGYGVLLYDARGRGRSEGTQNSFGWGWDHDVVGAVAFRKARAEVDPERIGGLGLSTGADVLIEAAGKRRDLGAVVADGAAAGSFEDWRHLVGINALTSLMAVEFATVQLTSGAKPGPALDEMIRRGRSPLLLISGGRDYEHDFNARYDRLAGDRDVAHWNLPNGSHTGGLRQAPRQYEQRVTAFFDANLR